MPFLSEYKVILTKLQMRLTADFRRVVYGPCVYNPGCSCFLCFNTHTIQPHICSDGFPPPIFILQIFHVNFPSIYLCTPGHLPQTRKVSIVRQELQQFNAYSFSKSSPQVIGAQFCSTHLSWRLSHRTTALTFPSSTQFSLVFTLTFSWQGKL